MSKYQTLFILLILIQGSYQQYLLNGKPTDTCPFYTTLNTETSTCEPNQLDSGETYTVLSEFWYKKNIALTDLDTRWSLGNVDSGTVISNCGTVQIYGGHNALKSSNKKVRSLSASYSNLAPHKEIQLNFKFFFIDSWDNEPLTIKIDGVVIETYKFRHNSSPSQICGGSTYDEVKDFHYDISHSSDTLTIQIEWSLDENSDNESGGIREIQVVSTAKTLYYLNGKFTDRCPFYAPANLATKTCVDPLFASTQTSQYELLDESLFQKQFDHTVFKLSNWVPDNIVLSSDCVSICSSLSLFGGYKKLSTSKKSTKSITASFYDMEPHTKIILKFQFWFIDSWDSESLRVRVNGVEVQKRVFKKETGSRMICGNGYYLDFVENQIIEISHTTDYAEITIEWNLDEDEDNESGGVRELQITSLLQPTTYTLNGKKTDRCPWYTTLNEESLICEDSLVSSYQVPLLLDELFYRTDFSVYNLEKSSKFKRQFTDSKQNYVSNCNGLTLFGGYGALNNAEVRRKSIIAEYQNVEPHDEVTIRFNFYMLDTWDSNDNLQISIDGVVQKTFWKDNSNPKQFVCGTVKENDFLKTYTITLNHNSRNLEVQIFWDMNEDTYNESGGIRDLQVLARGIPPIDLHGKNTDMCPFYTKFNAESRVCVDEFTQSLGNPIIVSEALYKRQFSEQDLFSQGWTPLAVDTRNNYISTCGDIELYGGYKALSNTGKSVKSIKASYNGLQPHHLISLKFKFFFVDSWDNEKLLVTIDGVPQKGVFSSYGNNPIKTSVCGNSDFSDKNQFMVYNFNHTASTLNIEIAWHLDSSTADESGALRELQVVAAGCVQPRCISCSSESECLKYLPEPPKIEESKVEEPTPEEEVSEGGVDESAGLPLEPTGGSSENTELPFEETGSTGAEETGAEGETGAEVETGAEGETGAEVETGIEGETGAEVETETAGNEGETGAETETNGPTETTGIEGESSGSSGEAEGEVSSGETEPLVQPTGGNIDPNENQTTELEPQTSGEPVQPTDPAAFDLSYYQDNQEQFVDPLQPGVGENIPPVTQEPETISIPADIGFDEEDLSKDENVIDLSKLEEEQKQEEIATQECVILYSECFYEGEKQTFCDDSPYMIKKIKSIYIPSDIKRIKLFENPEFQGKKSEYTESQECLEEINYQFLLNSHLKISKRNSKQKFLRKNTVY